MLYLNVRKDNSFVMSDDVTFSRSVLIKEVKNEIGKSKVKDIELFFQKGTFHLAVTIDSETVAFDLYLKNITGAGWADKPGIKRCQVKNFKAEHLEGMQIVKLKHYNLILGYYNFDSNPILVAWDAYRYLNHETNRSCYVTVDSLKRGYEKRFYEGVVSSQKCWIFTGDRFDQFLKRYIEYVDEVYLKGEKQI